MKTKFSPAIVVLAALVGCGGSPQNSSQGEDTQADTATTQYQYTFDPSGLSTSVQTGTSSASISRQGDVLTAGSSTYRFDGLGRVVAIDDLSLVYGPDGHVAKAVRGARAASYLYDEDGERIEKLVDGTPQMAYVDDRVITATELDEPVRAGNEMIGYLKNGQFVLLATDARGTVEADSDGTQRLASPYGDRAVHPDTAQTLDFAAKSYDADLGADRMGVRDYDARIARFLQPDPLYLEHPEKCIEHVVDCNLYTYARNNPIQIVDPTGEDGVLLGGGASAQAGFGEDTRLGLSLGVEGGVFVDFGKNGMGRSFYPSSPTTWNWHAVQIRPYLTFSQANPFDKGTSVTGISAGAGGALTYVKDSSQVKGEGRGAALALPIPVGAQAAITSDGTLNGYGVSVGKGEGASGTISHGYTFLGPDLRAAAASAASAASSAASSAWSAASGAAKGALSRVKSWF